MTTPTPTASPTPTAPTGTTAKTDAPRSRSRFGPKKSSGHAAADADPQFPMLDPIDVLDGWIDRAAHVAFRRRFVAHLAATSEIGIWIVAVLALGLAIPSAFGVAVGAAIGWSIVGAMLVTGLVVVVVTLWRTIRQAPTRTQIAVELDHRLQLSGALLTTATVERANSPTNAGFLVLARKMALARMATVRELPAMGPDARPWRSGFFALALVVLAVGVLIVRETMTPTGGPDYDRWPLAQATNNAPAPSDDSSATPPPPTADDDDDAAADNAKPKPDDTDDTETPPHRDREKPDDEDTDQSDGSGGSGGGGGGSDGDSGNDGDGGDSGDGGSGGDGSTGSDGDSTGNSGNSSSDAGDGESADSAQQPSNANSQDSTTNTGDGAPNSDDIGDGDQSQQQTETPTRPDTGNGTEEQAGQPRRSAPMELDPTDIRLTGNEGEREKETVKVYTFDDDSSTAGAREIPLTDLLARVAPAPDSGRTRRPISPADRDLVRDYYDLLRAAAGQNR